MRSVSVMLLSAAVLHGQSYQRDVYPIFEKHCFGCHTEGTKMGSLDLETWEGLQRGGNHGTIIVPYKSRESRLYTMLTGEHSPAMPMDGKMLAAAQVNQVKQWIDNGAKRADAQIFSMAWRSDSGGRGMIATGRYQALEVMDAETRNPIWSVKGMADVVRAVVFSPDGAQIAAAGGVCGKKGEVVIWDVKSGVAVRKIAGHADCIYAAAYSPDGKMLATASYDKLIKLWDPATGAEIRTLKDHIDAVYSIAFTPDGKRLLSASADRSVKVWNPATGERLYTLSDATDGLNTLVVSPDGKLVAAAGLDKSIRVWRLGEKSGELLLSLISHEDAILDLAWSPDGKTIVSASADRSIKVYNATDLTEIRSIPGQPDWVYSLEFSPDGKRFAAGRYDGSLTIYDLAK